MRARPYDGTPPNHAPYAERSDRGRRSCWTLKMPSSNRFKPSEKRWSPQRGSGRARSAANSDETNMMPAVTKKTSSA